MKRIDRKKLVALDVDDLQYVHLPSAVGDYSTLCGQDAAEDVLRNEGEADEFGVRRLRLLPGARVDCPSCIQIWALARRAAPSLIDPDALERHREVESRADV